MMNMKLYRKRVLEAAEDFTEALVSDLMTTLEGRMHEQAVILMVRMAIYTTLTNSMKRPSEDTP